MTTPSRRRWTHKEAAEFQGKYGEMMLRTELKRLQGTKVSGRIASGNMAIDGRHFEIDYVVLVPRVGLVICEAKSLDGRIIASSRGEWRRQSSRERFFRNPCLQVLRARELIQRILAASGIDKWPLIPLVVMTTRAVSISIDRASPPQTDIVELTLLEKWLDRQNKVPDIHFVRADFERLREVMQLHRCEYDGPRRPDWTDSPAGNEFR